MDGIVTKIANQIRENQEMWMKAVLLSQLGEEFYGKPDREIAEEARKRGYELIHLAHQRVTDDPINPVMYEIRDKDNNVVSTFRLKWKRP